MLAIVLVILHIMLQAVTLPFSWLMFRIWDAAIRRKHKVGGAPLELATHFVVLVPAHNEASSIGATVKSLKDLDYPKHQVEIIVIADNCEDTTASIARLEGAQVLERFDQVKKSKGFALEYALQHLQKREQHPDAIVIVDADSLVERSLLKAFDRRLQSGQDWLQAYYTVANADDSWRTQMMTLAFAHINGVWLLGQDALGLGSALRGNGMAFSWQGLERCPLQAYGLAEDLEFSWRLRLAGERVFFVPEVRVFGEMIDRNPAATASQRLRWEHGRKQLRKTFLQEIREAPWSWARKFLCLCDLFMPALAAYTLRLVLILTTALALNAIDMPPMFDAWPAIFLGLALGQILNFGIYLLMPFLLMNLPKRYVKLIGIAPLYAFWKVGLLLKRAPAAWVRTERKKRS